MEEKELYPWDQMEDEPNDWFYRFSQYYLSQGYRRTLRRAFFLHETEGMPPGEKRVVGRENHRWQEMFVKWNWFERAEKYDESRLVEADAALKNASLKIRMATDDAVDTLMLLLTSPRYGVAAAREILDRGGLPARAIQDVNQKVNITADDMAAAAKEVDEWEKKIFNPSGSNANDLPSTSSTTTA